jgi:alpha-tubulin suppressor-like RCC1 family protein
MRAPLLAVCIVGLVACKQNDSEVTIGQAVTGVAVGGKHVCAIVLGGTLRCFGDNAAGQLNAVGLISVSDVAAGYAHGCAKLEGGLLRCWGANDFGQLGSGTTAPQSAPVAIAVGPVFAIAAGGAHTCAVLEENRSVMCWGRNDSGQLGDGSTTDRLLPVAVTGLRDVEELAAGHFHTCARLKDETVRCWGRNDAGQIGDGTIATPRWTPTQVPMLRGVKSIAAGLADTCAATGDGNVHCWGRANARSSPTAVSGFVAAAEVSLAATSDTTELCARISDHSVRCTTVFGAPARPISGVLNAVDLAAGGNGTCARSSNGALRCWAPGENATNVVL